jgi:polyhydroxyalkanoate synthesis repressor PhaR
MSGPARDDPKLSAPAATPSERLPVVVKKYANRRLYNTESSSYITLDTLAEMVRQGRDFVVYDAKSGEDITRGVLTQIIVEEEGKGRAMLPTGFLRQIIGFYGDNLQTLVPRYLEQSMAAFALQQQQMRRAMQQTMGGFFPFGIDEVNRQQTAMMERAMNLFAPFYKVAEQTESAQEAAQTVHEESKIREIDALRIELETLRAELSAKLAAAAPADPVSAHAAGSLSNEFGSPVLRTDEPLSTNGSGGEASSPNGHVDSAEAPDGSGPGFERKLLPPSLAVKPARLRSAAKD